MTKERISLHIDKKDLEEIDRLTKKFEFENRSYVLRNLISMGLEDARILDKLGVLSIVFAAGKLRSKLKLGFLTGKEGEMTLDQLRE